MDYRAVVHCSDSEWGNALVIDKWHREKGWSGIGYHEVIENGFPSHSHYKAGKRLFIKNGQIASGRFYDANEFIEDAEMGAHAYGHNRGSIAVCLIGVKDFTREQIRSLVVLLRLWQEQFKIPIENIIGHYEIDSHGKTCPNLDMDVIRRLVANKREVGELFRSLNLREVNR